MYLAVHLLSFLQLRQFPWMRSIPFHFISQSFSDTIIMPTPITSDSPNLSLPSFHLPKFVPPISLLLIPSSHNTKVKHTVPGFSFSTGDQQLSPPVKNSVTNNYTNFLVKFTSLVLKWALRAPDCLHLLKTIHLLLPLKRKTLSTW